MLEPTYTINPDAPYGTTMEITLPVGKTITIEGDWFGEAVPMFQILVYDSNESVEEPTAIRFNLNGEVAEIATPYPSRVIDATTNESKWLQERDGDE